MTRAPEDPRRVQADPQPLGDREAEWASLSAVAKHERLLCAAGHVFTTEGLDAPMPSVAAAAGAGVGSLYRQYPSKRDLLAALVARRLGEITDQARAASERTGDRWSVLVGMLRGAVQSGWADDFLGQAWHQVSDRPPAGERSRRGPAARRRDIPGHPAPVHRHPCRQAGPAAGLGADADAPDRRARFPASLTPGRIGCPGEVACRGRPHAGRLPAERDQLLPDR
jgi:AcrR family transcriptional regulator